MRDKPFTRPTIIAANEFVAAEVRTHTQINRIVLRLALEAEVPDDSSLGMEKKLDRLGRLVLWRAEGLVATVDGAANLAEAFVREAVAFSNQSSQDYRQLAFEPGLARDGFVVVWSEWDHLPSLRSALPDEVDLSASDDEVRTLLRHLQFPFRSATSITRSRRIRAATGTPQTPSFAPFSKLCSTT